MGPKLTQAEGFVLGVGAKMFSCCGARCAPCRQCGCVAHRPRPLTRLLPPAAGGSRLAPHCRTCYCLWRKCRCSLWSYLLDNNIVLTVGTPVLGCPIERYVFADTAGAVSLHYRRGRLRHIDPPKRLDQVVKPFFLYTVNSLYARLTKI